MTREKGDPLPHHIVTTIRERHYNGEYQSKLADEYNVSQSVVSRIINGKLYRDVPGPIKVHQWVHNKPRPDYQAMADDYRDNPPTADEVLDVEYPQGEPGE